MNYYAILPEILLTVLTLVVVLVDLRLSDENKGRLPWIVFFGFAATFVVTILFSRPIGNTPVWGGMLRYDLAAFLFRLIFLAGAAFTVLFAMDWEGIGKRGEFYILLIVSTIGMNLMGASADLMMLFLAIETASIPLYVMAGFLVEDNKSTESGIKYLLFGAMTSSVMLYGFSLLYGFAGTTDLYALAGGLANGNLPATSLIGAVALILVGFGFKISMFPFHFWVPDVYEGAPTPVTGFLSTASKAAGFIVIVRVLTIAFPVSAADWTPYVAWLSAATMTIGNLVALRQTNIKRLLAYSSVAHAGYILLGVAAASELGVLSVAYYAVVYLFTNLAAFGIIAVYFKVSGSDEIKSYAGLSKRNPVLAIIMLLTFLSLGGIPPLGGFIGKVLVFAAAVEAGLVWLAIVGVLNAIIGLYYYLIVLKAAYLDEPEDASVLEQPLTLSRTHSYTLAVLTFGIFIFGVLLVPLYNWSGEVAAALF